MFHGLSGYGPGRAIKERKEELYGCAAKKACEGCENDADGFEPPHDGFTVFGAHSFGDLSFCENL